jgi:uncharacterized membrane protein
MRYAVAYAATLVALLALDAVWLGTVGGSLFKRTLGDVLAPDFAVVPALLFYAIYVVGILYFALLPGIDGASWSVALTRGVLFGFFAYMTYDLTNLATLRNYTLTLALTDMIWGALVTGAASTAGFFVTGYVTRRFG